MKSQPTVWEIRDRLDENFQRIRHILENPQPDSANAIQLGAIAEARLNIALAEKAYDSTLNAEAERRFEDAVLQTLERASPNLRKECIRRLNEREQTWRSKYERRPRTP